MKKPETTEAKATTFTKRRSGLLTKAAELCIICSSQVAMLVNSPNKKHGKNKVHSFGHSSVDAVFNAFLNDHVPDAAHLETKKYADSLYNESKASEFNHDQYMKNKRQKREAGSGYWWEFEDLDNIQSVEVLRLVIDKMKRLKENVKIRLNTLKNNKHDGESQHDHHYDGQIVEGNEHKYDFQQTVTSSPSKYVYNFDQSYVGGDYNTKKADERTGVEFKGNDNGSSSHFKLGNNVIINNDNNKHNGESQCDHDCFSTLGPLEVFNDYNPSLSSIYGPSFVNLDYNRTVPELASSFSNVGQIVEGNKQNCGFQHTATSSASKYAYNFDQSYVGGEYNTKKADECKGVEFKDTETNSWANTAQNLPSFGYLNQGVMDTMYNAKLDHYRTSADSTSNSIVLNMGNNDAPLFTDAIRTLDCASSSILLNVGNNDAPLFTDAIRTLDCAYQSVNVNPRLPMSIAGTAEYKGAASQK